MLVDEVRTEVINTSHGNSKMLTSKVDGRLDGWPLDAIQEYEVNRRKHLLVGHHVPSGSKSVASAPHWITDVWRLDDLVTTSVVVDG